MTGLWSEHAVVREGEVVKRRRKKEFRSVPYRSPRFFHAYTQREEKTHG
jgi:hypothetical protein